MQNREFTGSIAAGSRTRGPGNIVRLFYLLILLCCLLQRNGLCGSETETSSEVPVFSNISAESGIDFIHISGDRHNKSSIMEAKGGGIAAFDYDNDGWVDILVVQGSTLETFHDPGAPFSRLYRNLGKGRFEDVTAEVGLGFHGWGMGAATADYDNDGDTDLYLTCFGRNVLYENREGVFVDITDRAGVGDSRWSTSASFADYNNDGYLDLYVSNYLDIDVQNLALPGSGPNCYYLGVATFCGPRGIKGATDSLYFGTGDGKFDEVSEKTGAVDEHAYFGLGVISSDLDNDGDLDIYVANDATPNLLFENLGDGTFREVALSCGLALSGDAREQASMGLDSGDFNNDGWLDLFATHFASDYSTLYENRGGLVFEDISFKAGIVRSEWLLVSWGTRFADFNHDGWKDIYHSNGHVYPFLLEGRFKERYYQHGTLLINRQDGTFLDVSAEAGLDRFSQTAGRGTAFADFDNDGDIDIVVACLGDRPLLIRNDRRDLNHWIQFKLIGRVGNRDGIGARILIWSGGKEQQWEVKRTVGIYSSSDPRAHFGLGGNQKVERMEIRWPGGRTQKFENIAADQHYVLDEEKGLSPQKFQALP